MYGLIVAALWLAVVLGVGWLIWSRRDSLGLKDASAPGDPASYRGFFYNNPSDPRLFVPKRFSMGWTVNLAHPHARTVVGLMFFLPIIILMLAAFRH